MHGPQFSCQCRHKRVCIAEKTVRVSLGPNGKLGFEGHAITQTLQGLLSTSQHRPRILCAAPAWAPSWLLECKAREAHDCTTGVNIREPLQRRAACSSFLRLRVVDGIPSYRSVRIAGVQLEITLRAFFFFFSFFVHALMVSTIKDTEPSASR